MSIYSFETGGKRYKRRMCLNIRSLLVIMWIGGYDDWTPAEQRDWDRGLEENARWMEEKKAEEERALNAIPADSKTWKEWATDNPLYKACVSVNGGYRSHDYTVWLYENSPVRRDVKRDLLFEVGNPIYQAFHLPRRIPQGTSQIRLHVSSYQYKNVEYTCYCTPETWSYTVMEEILHGLNEQLTPPQDLNKGLKIKLSFVKL